MTVFRLPLKEPAKPIELRVFVLLEHGLESGDSVLVQLQYAGLNGERFQFLVGQIRTPLRRTLRPRVQLYLGGLEQEDAGEQFWSIRRLEVVERRSG
jgi:hypothetical protein